MEVSFAVIFDMLGYIVSISWTQLPYSIAMLGACILIAYCAAMFLIAFPVSIWEHFAKKKVNDEKKEIVIAVVTVIFSVILIYATLYGKVR